jgi:hypothetical protein
MEQVHCMSAGRNCIKVGAEPVFPTIEAAISTDKMCERLWLFARSGIRFKPTEERSSKRRVDEGPS